jgi:hypothetical protein
MAVKGIDYQIELIEELQLKAKKAGEDASVNTMANTLRGLYVARHQQLIRSNTAIHKDAVYKCIEQILGIFATHVSKHVPEWSTVAREMLAEAFEVADALENSSAQQKVLDCKRER